MLIRVKRADDVPRVIAEEIQRYDWKMHETFVSTRHNGLIANVYRVTAIKVRMAVQSRGVVVSGAG